MHSLADDGCGQTLPILLLSLMGALLTGELLATLQVSRQCLLTVTRAALIVISAQNWSVFIRVEELFILVPILLNLKGNLEMNLASRFSTSVSTLNMRNITQR